MLIHAGVVSDQSLPNVIPVLIEQPARIYLACSPSTAEKGLDRRLAAFLKTKGIATTIVHGVPDAGLMTITQFARAFPRGLYPQQ